MWSHISHSLLLTLLHSFWQSALLLLLYLGISNQQQVSVRGRKNLLLILLSGQVFMSLSMFGWLMYQGAGKPSTQTLFSSTIPGLADMIPASLSALYMLAVIWQVARTLYQWHKQQSRFKKGFIQPSQELISFVHRNALTLGIRKPVEVWFTDQVMTPLTYGFIRPVILFPIALYNQLSMDESEALLLHELSHIREHDFLTNWMIVIAESLFFFNPFIQRIIREYQLEREFTCDEFVVNSHCQPVLYAEALLKTARFSHQSLRLDMAAVSGNDMLLSRIIRMTKGQEQMTATVSRKRFSNFFAVVILLLSLTGFWFLSNPNTEKKLSENTIAALPVSGNKPINDDYKKSYSLNKNAGAMVMVIDDEPQPARESDLKPSDKPAAPDQLDLVTYRPAQNLELPESQGMKTDMQIIPVSVQEKQDEPAKEIIIQDEDPGSGMKITRAYRPYLEEGEWKAELLWVMTEEKPLPETLRFFLMNFSRSILN